MQTIEGNLWDSRLSEFVSAQLSWDMNGRIDQVAVKETRRDVFIVPGFVDVHVHGAGGADAMDSGGGALDTIAQQLARYGVTGFLATTLTATPDALLSAVSAVAARSDSGTGAKVIGLHLEGPYIDPDHRGAQPRERIRPVNLDELTRLLDAGRGTIRIMTLAPEMPGALEAIGWLTARGVRVNLGHTGCDLATAREAVERGADGVTHLFNAMPPLGHRSPGLVGLALSDSRLFVEVIADGVHLDPTVVRMAWAAAGHRTVAITDAVSAVGLAPGIHHLGELSVAVDESAVRLPSGSLAGSILTLDRAYRNLLGWGVSEADVIHSVSEAPLKRLGITDRGRLEVGQAADFVVLNEERQVLATVREGKTIYTRKVEESTS